LAFRPTAMQPAPRIPSDAYVMIIGAMRSGTTSLYRYLIEHPQICTCRVKEPEYFSQHQSHGYRVERYGDLWEFDAARHRYVLEASTGYTKYPAEQGVPRRIREEGLAPRFVYVVRNPFDRILSHYNHHRLLTLLGLRRRWLRLTSDHLVNVSDYFLQLEQYRRYFPKESILVLDFDELRGAPGRALTRVYDFLELAEIQVAARFRRYNAMPRMLQKREIPARDRAVMRDRLRPGMERLQQEYGIDVRKWGFG
jgi:hypothetical protein